MNKTDFPSKDEYCAALREVIGNLSEPQRRMLRAHAHAPAGTISTDELAMAAGFQNWKPVNMHYGLVGTALRTALGERGRVPGQQSHILADFLPPDESHRRWRWVMHRPLREALRELGWFDEDLLGEGADETLQLAALEGNVLRKLTVHRSRESILRQAKLLQTRRAHPQNRLLCEVPGCGFDFERVYGELGIGYAEVHHLVPLATIDEETITSLDDLAVVCSNCHRMIHRGGQCRDLRTLLART